MCIASVQSQESWPPIGSWWAYELLTMGSSEYISLCATNDTIIGDRSCKEIQYRVFSSFEPPDVKRTYMVTDSGQYTYISNANDSIFYYVDSVWRYMYNFSSTVGDNHELYGIDSTLCDSTIILSANRSVDDEFILPISNRMTVSSIEQGVSFGLKEYTRISYNFEPEIWGFREGIFVDVGPTTSFLPQPIADCFSENFFIYTSSLTCFEIPNGAIETSSAICNIIAQNLEVLKELSTSVETRAKSPSLIGSNIHLYPNPVIDRLEIHNLNERLLDGIFIYNSVGNILLYQEGYNPIDLSGYTSGVYYVSVNYRNGLNKVFKFIKI